MWWFGRIPSNHTAYIVSCHMRTVLNTILLQIRWIFLLLLQTILYYFVHLIGLSTTKSDLQRELNSYNSCECEFMLFLSFQYEIKAKYISAKKFPDFKVICSDLLVYCWGSGKYRIFLRLYLFLCQLYSSVVCSLIRWLFHNQIYELWRFVRWQLYTWCCFHVFLHHAKKKSTKTAPNRSFFPWMTRFSQPQINVKRDRLHKEYNFYRRREINIQTTTKTPRFYLRIYWTRKKRDTLCANLYFTFDFCYLLYILFFFISLLFFG